MIQKYSDDELAKIAERYHILWSRTDHGPYLVVEPLIMEELYGLMRALLERSDPNINFK